MNIKLLVVDGKLKEALKALIGEGIENATIVLAQYNDLCSAEGLGTISRDDANRERNNIRKSILDMANALDSGAVVTERKNVFRKLGGDIGEELTGIITENKRRRADIADKAKALLQTWQTYKLEKSTKPTYDIAGKAMEAIKIEMEAIRVMLDKDKAEAQEKIVTRIEELLSDSLPTYEQLRQAYTLAAGRGYFSDYVEMQLKLEPEDNEVRITVAEMLEKFAATISKR